MSSIEEVTKTINLIIAPVVTITTCAIVVNGLIVRYGSLGDRLHAVNQELSNLQESDLAPNGHKAQKVQELESLLRDLLRHHHFVHDALVLTYTSILVFMLDMLVISIAVATNVNWLAQMALIVFLSGVTVLFGGMVLIAYELRTSHYSIQLEVHRTCRLCRHQHTKLVGN
ncbi:MULTISPECIES: DUF2721 domain-containing protein [Trichocoleus]|uniref:DUF2721 domain-containing protein n=1 Tax=Trichocoleus desertorum GB2-A4 TaxID=2933944 RepID=A0ABV0JFV9_9CYAN|nr:MULTISPECIES: DUF2721 domain-containing protein [unclassified Trichocoleus]MBD1865244.1 DUF2721 domain-containing protein [Trichocoleus sp. FACHB-46]MBD2095706.1 DUF2721 domain-containing protein [Trichocoleus sp. FACHB-591]